MPESDDHQLLAEFVRCGSEAAFSGLVARYVGLVYSTALRFSNNPHHAEEITQAVFVILAHKARTLSSRVVLSGWLYQTARLTAANFVKGEIRRQRREQEVYMQSTLPNPETTDWAKIAPLLDEAMGDLGETDRNAVVLRFFENRTSTEIGAALRMNEETARKRVNRALEKLRKFFSKRGVNSTTAAIGETIAANSIQAPPVGLASTISYAALSAKTTATTLVAAKTMTLFQKLLTGATAAALVGVAIYSWQLQKQNQALQLQQTSSQGQLQQLQQQLSDASNQIASLNGQIASSERNEDELLRLRAEVTQSHRNESLPQAIATLPSEAGKNSDRPPNPPFQIEIKTRFYFIPDVDLQSMGIAWTADPQGGQMGYLDDLQFRNIIEAMRGASDITVLAEPGVVTLNGRETEMFEGTPTNFGEMVQIIPYYSTNSSTFNLNFEAVVSQLSGDPSQPVIQKIVITNDVSFTDGKTLVLEQPIPTGSWLPGMTNIPTGPQDLTLYVTPTPVDPAGNRIPSQYRN